MSQVSQIISDPSRYHGKQPCHPNQLKQSELHEPVGTTQPPRSAHHRTHTPTNAHIVSQPTSSAAVCKQAEWGSAGRTRGVTALSALPHRSSRASRDRSRVFGSPPPCAACSAMPHACHGKPCAAHTRSSPGPACLPQLQVSAQRTSHDMAI